MPITLVNPRLTGTEEQKKQQLDALEKAYAERKAVTEYAPSHASNIGDDYDHKSKLDDWGILGALLMHLFRFFLNCGLNFNYYKKLRAFNAAKNNDKDKNRAYDPDAANNPDIYPVDPKTLKPLMNEAPLEKSKIDDLTVILNGYKPVPTVAQGFWDSLSEFMVGISGPEVLNHNQMLHLYGTTQLRSDSRSESADKSYDLQAINAANASRAAANRVTK